ncbi:hypothetical protein RclHR1_01200019 [Rhizophagus clarus]|uniref:Uncharacterized protein n=1 Tax=Rhizophagus clarus TaxID=94130 RepID=A0A2Z6Q7H4_9GLOM|nr:hypothetical protein RclHR1_01200019 [Rhizophagus clarus]
MFISTQNLCVHNLYSEQTLNANKRPSEYAFQSEFAIIFKNILGKVYSAKLPQYKVLVEAKEHVKGGTRRQPSNENFKNHIKRSQHYGKIYKCTMFMVNLCPKPILSSYFGENDEQFEDDDDDEYDDDDEDEYERVSLTPVNVIIRENLAQAWQGELKYKDGDSEVVSINVLDGTCSSIEMSLM